MAGEAAGACNPRVRVKDEYNMWEIVGSEFQQRLILNGLRLQSPSGKYVMSNGVRLSPEVITPQTPQRPAAAELALNWHTEPYASIFLLRCESYDDYRSSRKEAVRRFLQDAQQTPQGGRDESLIVYVPLGDEKAAKRSTTSELNKRAKQHKKVFEKLKADFSKESVLRLELLDLVTREDQWSLLLDALGKALQRCYATRRLQYAKASRKIAANRELPGWNFSQYFLIKESWALSLEQLQLQGEALRLYDDLLAELRELPPSSVPVLIPDNKDKDNDDSSNLPRSIFDTISRPYRELVRRNHIGELEFRRYVFARQSSLLLQRHLPAEVVRRALALLPELCSLVARDSGRFAQSLVAVQQEHLHAWVLGACFDIGHKCEHCLTHSYIQQYTSLTQQAGGGGGSFGDEGKLSGSRGQVNEQQLHKRLARTTRELKARQDGDMRQLSALTGDLYRFALGLLLKHAEDKGYLQHDLAGEFGARQARPMDAVLLSPPQKRQSMPVIEHRAGDGENQSDNEGSNAQVKTTSRPGTQKPNAKLRLELSGRYILGDAAWRQPEGEDPPADAATALQMYNERTRRALEALSDEVCFGYMLLETCESTARAHSIAGRRRQLCRARSTAARVHFARGRYAEAARAWKLEERVLAQGGWGLRGLRTRALTRLAHAQSKLRRRSGFLRSCFELLAAHAAGPLPDHEDGEGCGGVAVGLVQQRLLEALNRQGVWGEEEGAAESTNDSSVGENDGEVSDTRVRWHGEQYEDDDDGTSGGNEDSNVDASPDLSTFLDLRSLRVRTRARRHPVSLRCELTLDSKFPAAVRLDVVRLALLTQERGEACHTGGAVEEKEDNEDHLQHHELCLIARDVVVEPGRNRVLVWLEDEQACVLDGDQNAKMTEWALVDAALRSRSVFGLWATPPLKKAGEEGSLTGLHYGFRPVRSSGVGDAHGAGRWLGDNVRAHSRFSVKALWCELGGLELRHPRPDTLKVDSHHGIWASGQGIQAEEEEDEAEEEIALQVFAPDSDSLLLGGPPARVECHLSTGAHGLQSGSRLLLASPTGLIVTGSGACDDIGGDGNDNCKNVWTVNATLVSFGEHPCTSSRQVTLEELSRRPDGSRLAVLRIGMEPIPPHSTLTFRVHVRGPVEAPPSADGLGKSAAHGPQGPDGAGQTEEDGRKHWSALQAIHVLHVVLVGRSEIKQPSSPPLSLQWLALHCTSVALRFRQPLRMRAGIERLGGRWFLQVVVGNASNQRLVIAGNSLSLPPWLHLERDCNAQAAGNRLAAGADYSFVFELGQAAADTPASGVHESSARFGISLLTDEQARDSQRLDGSSKPPVRPLEQSWQIDTHGLSSGQALLHVVLSFPPSAPKGELIPFEVTVSAVEEASAGGGSTSPRASAGPSAGRKNGDEGVGSENCSSGDELDMLVELCPRPELWMLAGKTCTAVRLRPGKRATLNYSLLPIASGYLPIPTVRLYRRGVESAAEANADEVSRVCAAVRQQKTNHIGSAALANFGGFAPISQSGVLRHFASQQIYVIPSRVSVNAVSYINH